jgi:hypothetical protein
MLVRCGSGESIGIVILGISLIKKKRLLLAIGMLCGRG